MVPRTLAFILSSGETTPEVRQEVCTYTEASDDGTNEEGLGLISEIIEITSSSLHRVWCLGSV